jgi:hypothetical protein
MFAFPQHVVAIESHFFQTIELYIKHVVEMQTLVLLITPFSIFKLVWHRFLVPRLYGSNIYIYIYRGAVVAVIVW